MSRSGEGAELASLKLRSRPGDRYADVFVDTAKSREVYEEWKKLTKPAKGPLRRPLWMNRPLGSGSV